MGLVQGVDNQHGRCVSLGEEECECRTQPGAAQVTELIQRARHGGGADVAHRLNRREQVVYSGSSISFEGRPAC